MKLTFDEYLNCLLVEHDGRDGYLFQWIDYGEHSVDAPITKMKLQTINELFPDLSHSICEQGVMISKMTFTKDELNNNDDLAEVLSYCCPITFADVSVKYSYDINITLKNGRVCHLMSYMCDKGCNTCDEFANRVASDFRSVLSYIDTEIGDDYVKCVDINSVNFVKQMHYNEEYYIDRLSTFDNTVELSRAEMEGISNYLFNLGFSERFQEYFEHQVEIDNPIHRGILIGLLTQSRHNVMEPFWPLQRHLEEAKVVSEKTIEWERALIKTFGSTKLRR